MKALPLKGNMAVEHLPEGHGAPRPMEDSDVNFSVPQLSRARLSDGGPPGPHVHPWMCRSRGVVTPPPTRERLLVISVGRHIVIQFYYFIGERG